jgi:hypothetical protein
MSFQNGYGKPGAGRRIYAAYGPLIFILAYLALTYLIFIYGPLSWILSRKAYLLTSLLVVGCMAGLAIGYWLNMRRGMGGLRRSLPERDGYSRLGRLLTLLFVVSALSNILTVWVRLLLMYNPVLDIWQSILHPGLGYVQGQGLQSLYEVGEIPESISRFAPLFRTITLFSGLTVLYYPLGWLSWRRLGLELKLLFAASLLSTLLYYWILGTQMGFGMMVFVALPVLLYRAACVQRDKPGRKAGVPARLAKWFRAYRSVLLQAVCLLLGFVIIFGGMQVARAAAKNPDSDSGTGVDVGTTLSDTSLYRFRFGDPSDSGAVAYSAMMLSFYVGNGYAGLGKSIDLPFEWTYGLNWSNGLLQLAQKYFGVTGVWERSYLYRNEQVNGWPALLYWSTLYAWLASDVTYWGVPVVMLLLGVFFAAVWKDLIVRGNAMAAVVLGQLFMLFIMIPANNQLFNTIGMLFSSLLVLALYIFSRTKLYRAWNRGGESLAGEEAPA